MPDLSAKDLTEDGMFPLKTMESRKVKVGFKLGDDKLIVEKSEQS